MSLGAWALVVFSVFVAVSFLGAFLRDRRGVEGAGILAKLWSVVGAVAGLFIAGYTGVLLAVSNQPVWSDTWALGGLFLASGLAGSAALLGWLIRFRAGARPTAEGFVRAERYFIVLELALVVALVVTLIPAGMLGRAFGFPWILLWLVAAFAGLLPWLRRAAPGLGLTTVVLVGVLALRAAVIFSAQ
jgi:formate-dependent nitrite reductase membrane component NrfD